MLRLVQLHLPRRCHICRSRSVPPHWRGETFPKAASVRRDVERSVGVGGSRQRRTHLTWTWAQSRDPPDRCPRRLDSALGELSARNFASGGAIKHSTREQRRAALLELDRMNQSTSRLLDTDLKGAATDAHVNEARVALRYWSRRWYLHFHPGFGKAAKGSALSLDAVRRWGDGDVEGTETASENGAPTSDNTDVKSSTPVQNHGGDHGARMAERLLDWSLSNDLVQRGIFDYTDDLTPYMDKEDKEGGNLAGSPNLTCVNMMDTFLIPTAYGGAGGGSAMTSTLGRDGQRNIATAMKNITINSSYVQAVVDATRVMRKMRQMQAEFPDRVFPDTLSIKAELNIWRLRAILVGNNVRHSVFGDASMIDSKEVLRRLEREDASNNGWELYEESTYTVRGCLDQMESILSRAEQRYASTRDKRIHPSVDWYNLLLGAWARSDLEGALERMKEMLHGMEAHDDVDDDLDGALERTKDITNGLDACSDDGLETPINVRKCWAGPNTISYNSVLSGIAQDSEKDLIKDAVSKARARNRCKKRAQEAESLLRNIVERHRRTGRSSIKPDEVTYGAVLHAMAQAGLAPEAERILDSLEDGDDDDNEATKVVPSLTIYNTVLNAWANSGLFGAPRRAESLLERMRTLSSTGRNPGIAPDTVGISTAILCHARSQTRAGAERGEAMLDEALVAYHKGKGARPDLIMFNCAITGWSNISGVESEQGAFGKDFPAERAESLLQKMKFSQLDIHPQTATFNIILDAWSKSKMKGASLRALTLMRKMPDFGAIPDEVTYNTVLMAMTNEGDRKSTGRAEELFQELKEKMAISKISYHVVRHIIGCCVFLFSYI
ncbi:hypothetical protein ACHAWF_012854 [Thalassiosira exigua]